ncbi:hypothetical protein JST56_07275 [Candidatus Dependentiae bacterium]|nr:hypothetical protein [Candidatus Dependentiae bacterium]
MAGIGMNSNPKHDGHFYSKSTSTPVNFAGAVNVLYGFKKWEIGFNSTIQPINIRYNNVRYTYGNPATSFQAIAYRHFSIVRVGLSAGYINGNIKEGKLQFENKVLTSVSYSFKGGITAGIHVGIDKYFSKNIAVLADLSYNLAVFNHDGLNYTDINAQPVKGLNVHYFYYNALVGVGFRI